MTDFAPPVGPPPPKVPEGWKAVWNDQYSEYFYVNIYTKQSQWDKPTEPVYPPGEAPDAPPPSYPPPASSTAPSMTTEKSTLGSNNPYASGASAAPHISEDERLARQLQEEEESRARGHRGADSRGLSNSYYNQQYGTPQPGQYGHAQQSSSPYSQGQSVYNDPTTQDKGKSKSFLGKLLGKAGGGSGSRPHEHPSRQGGYDAPSYGVPGYGAPGPGGPYGGQAPYGQPGHYPQHQQMYGRPAAGRKPGMGVGGAAALGVGGGLLGGAMLGSALADDGGDTYIENNYGDDGGDFDGGDF